MAQVDDGHFMKRAFALFGVDADPANLPIGAVVVHEGEVIGSGKNEARSLDDPTQHAEMQALREAIAALQERYSGQESVKSLIKKVIKKSAIYSTLEPCPMCAGAILMFKVKRVVIGMPDHKWGAMGTVDRLEGFPAAPKVFFSDLPELLPYRNAPSIQVPEVKEGLWALGRKFRQELEETVPLLHVLSPTSTPPGSCPLQ